MAVRLDVVVVWGGGASIGSGRTSRGSCGRGSRGVGNGHGGAVVVLLRLLSC